jgi:hypothetical protein
MRTGSLLGVACIVLTACGEKDPGPAQDDCSSSTGGVDVQLLTRAHSQFFGTQPSPVTWVAAQDGTCGWKRLDGPQGEYHFSVKNGRFGVAVGCARVGSDGTDISWVSTFFQSTTEGTALYAECTAILPDSTPTHDIAVTFGDTLPFDFRYWIRDYDSGRFGQEGAITTDTFRAASGTHDLVVGAFQSIEGVEELKQLILRRGLESASDQAEQVDLSSPDWFVPGTATITFDKSDQEVAQLVAGYITTHRTRPTLDDPFDIKVGAAGPVSFAVPVVPADHREGDELHQIRAVAISGSVTRTAEVFVKDLASMTLQLPQRAPRHAVSCVASQSCTLRLDARPDAVAYVAAWAKDSDLESRRVYVTVTPGYLGTTSTLLLPDFAAVSGWDPHWTWDRAGASWTVTTLGGNRGFAGEQNAEGAMRDDRPLAELDGLTRWTYVEQITATGT